MQAAAQARHRHGGAVGVPHAVPVVPRAPRAHPDTSSASAPGARAGRPQVGRRPTVCGVGLRPTVVQAGGTPALPGTPAGLRPACGRGARDPRNSCGPPARLRAGRPRSQGLLRACGPLAGGTPAIPGTPAGLRPACGRGARDPGNSCEPSDRLRAGRSRFRELLRACGPLAGGTPAIPGTPAGLRTACRRDARDPGNSYGPADRLRTGRPRSRELLRACGPLAGGASAILGTPAGLQTACGRGARDPGNSCGHADRLRAGRLRSRELLRACGPLAGGTPAIPGTPAGLRTACGRGARDPGNSSARCLSRDRGHLARFNTPVGLRPTAGGTPAIPGTPAGGAPGLTWNKWPRAGCGAPAPAPAQTDARHASCPADPPPLSAARTPHTRACSRRASAAARGGCRDFHGKTQNENLPDRGRRACRPSCAPLSSRGPFRSDR